MTAVLNQMNAGAATPAGGSPPPTADGSSQATPGQPDLEDELDLELDELELELELMDWEWNQNLKDDWIKDIGVISI